MFLMVGYRQRLITAYNHVVKCKKGYLPNEGFRYQLAMMEIGLYGETSVAGQDAGPNWHFTRWQQEAHKHPQWAGEKKSSICAVM